MSLTDTTSFHQVSWQSVQSIYCNAANADENIKSLEEIQWKRSRPAYSVHLKLPRFQRLALWQIFFLFVFQHFSHFLFRLSEIEHQWWWRLHEGAETDSISSFLPADHHLHRARGGGWATPIQSQPGPVQRLEAKAVAEKGPLPSWIILRLFFILWHKTCTSCGRNRLENLQHILYNWYVLSPFDAFKIGVMKSLFFCILL